MPLSLRSLIASFVVALALVPAAVADEPCGGLDSPCKLDDGVYYVALPSKPVGAPLVLWLHGYGRSGAVTVGNAELVATITGRGYALIAPSGQRDESDRTDWDVEDGVAMPRDEIDYLKAVLADAVSRFGLDGGRVLAAGFSRGGSMVWDLACRAPETAQAFAAVAGAFWEPMTEDCVAPVHLTHTHGFMDRLVPFEGRELEWNGHHFTQGNVMAGIDVWRKVNGCPGAAEDDVSDPVLWRKTWSDCAAGSLTLTLWNGAHGVPPGWVTGVLDWFETKQ